MPTQAVNLYRPTRNAKISTYRPRKGESAQQALAASRAYFEQEGPGICADDIVVVEQSRSLEVYRITEDGVPVFLNIMPAHVEAMLRA